MTVERERGLEGVHDVRCASTHEACTDARHEFETTLADAHVAPQDAAMAALGLGELLSNAVRHGSPDRDGRFGVSWTLDEDSVRVAVSDAGDAGELVPRLPDAAATSGRGLWMIDKISTEWGVDTEHGTEVWAVFAASRLG